MTQYSGFRVGNFVGPLTADTTNPLLQDADPALYWTLDYFKSMIQTYLGARWDAQMTLVGLTQYVGKASTAALSFDPLPFLQVSGVQPPILALFPVKDRPAELTRAWYHVVQEWKLLWILPPMDAAQFNQLSSLLRAAGKILQDRIENTLDPSWQSGTPFAQLGGIEEIRMEEIGYGQVPDLSTNLFLPTLFATLQVKERRGVIDGIEDLEGASATVAVQDADGQEDLVEMDLS